MDSYFMAMFEIRIAVRGNELKVWGVFKQFVAGDNKNAIFMKCDTPETPIPTAALPVYIHRVPVDGLLDAFFFKVDDIDTTMAFALAAASDYRGGDKFNHSQILHSVLWQHRPGYNQR